jgi:ribosomal protein L12E/L44/L45/RPP1/RPP2
VGTLTPEERATFVTSDSVGAKYDELVDSESAHEMLAARAEAAVQTEAAAKQQADTEKLEKQREREAAKPSMADKMFQSAGRAMASSVGRQIGNQLLRGILGSLRVR